MPFISMFFAFIEALLRNKLALAAENLALRQQVAVQMQTIRKPKLRKRDRVFWVVLSRVWSSWRSALAIVQPETVIRWHRSGFKLFWNWKSRRRRKAGRPGIAKEIRDLIRRMSRENPTWGYPKIQMELKLLGHEVSRSTVQKYMDRSNKPPSQTWRSFLLNHARDIAAIDFFTVPTATFNILFCFIVLDHLRRQIIHFAVTARPSAAWTGKQLLEAFPWDTARKYLLRDNDGIYKGKAFLAAIESLEIEEVRISPHCPWQNPFAERIIGSVRYDCLNHMIIVNEAHLHRILSDYFRYYNESRAHRSLNGNTPIPREEEPPESGKIRSISYLGGLHHRYTRAA